MKKSTRRPSGARQGINSGPVAPVSADDTRPVLPDEFVRRCEAYSVTASLPRVLTTTDPEVSVRLNPLKQAPRPDTATGTVPWCDRGYYLDSRPVFTLDPALHQGLYYVQDASSMAIGHVVAQLSRDMPAPLTYLDACAAPGGKTTAAISALPPASVVVANEFDPKRASALAQNLRRWGYASILATRGDTERFRLCPGTFDIIAADVPCSGEGMMRKDARAVAQWSPRLVESCAALQRDILGNLWEALRPGGYLIYSTCTFNREENEINLQWMADTLGAEPVKTDLDTFCGVTTGIDTTLPCYRFIPGLIRGEGLFVAVVRKPGILTPSAAAPADMQPSRRIAARRRAGAGALTRDVTDILDRWLTGDYKYDMSPTGEIRAMPASNADTLDRLADILGGVIIKGIAIASMRGNQPIPHYDLARAIDIRTEAFATADIDIDRAIDYLRRQSISLPGDTDKGIVLLTYAGRPLGFVKNLGSRANNLLPASERILSI